MLDTKGPEIRLRDFEGGRAELVSGQQFVILPVHFADIGHGQHRSRHIDALVVGDEAAVHHPADDILPG